MKSVLSCAEEVEARVSRDSLPIPDGGPVASIHQAPDLLEEFGNSVCVAEPCIAPDGPHGGADTILLCGREAGGADDETRDKKEGLARVAGLEAI